MLGSAGAAVSAEHEFALFAGPDRIVVDQRHAEQFITGPEVRLEDEVALWQTDARTAAGIAIGHVCLCISTARFAHSFGERRGAVEPRWSHVAMHFELPGAAERIARVVPPHATPAPLGLHWV